MPTYDYRCNACGHTYELYQSMTESTKRKCPECGKLKLERLIGAGSAVLFKGGGFYETDYRSKSYTDAAKADKQGGSDAGKSSEPKSSKKGSESGSSGSEKKADSSAKSPKKD